MTEMVKDEWGGSEIISHNKSRERDPRSSDDIGLSLVLMSSSPAHPELSILWLRKPINSRKH